MLEKNIKIFFTNRGHGVNLRLYHCFNPSSDPRTKLLSWGPLGHVNYFSSEAPNVS